MRGKSLAESGAIDASKPLPELLGDAYDQEQRELLEEALATGVPVEAIIGSALLVAATAAIHTGYPLAHLITSLRQAYVAIDRC